MSLKPASSADYRPYALEVGVEPTPLSAGNPGRITFRLRTPDGRRVTQLELLHEKIFHLFIVGYDLEHFAHLHPIQRADGSLDVDVVFPQPGPYKLIADFQPAGGLPQLVERTFVTAGYEGRISRTDEPTVDRADKVVNGTRVRLASPPSVAGREQLLTFELLDERTGQPLKDLEPYLGAAGHLLTVAGDLSGAYHGHPAVELSSNFGPEIVFQLTFGKATNYRLWFQFQRHGRVETVAFTIPVAREH